MRNSVFLIVSNNLERVISLIIFGIMVDKMSIYDFGMFKWVLSLSMFLIFILNLGLDSTVVRETREILNAGNTTNVNESLRDYLLFKSILFLTLGFFGFVISDYLASIADVEPMLIYATLLMALFGMFFRSLLETLTSINMKSYVTKNIDLGAALLLVTYLLYAADISLNHLLLLYLVKELWFGLFLIYYNRSSLNKNGIGYKLELDKEIRFFFFKENSFRKLWFGNAVKDTSFKLIDSGLDILLIGFFLTKRDVALYSFSSTIALILMNFNIFKMTRSFLNVFMLNFTNAGKDVDKVNNSLTVFGLINQIAVYVIYIPFLVIIYYVLNNYYPEYILAFPIIMFLSFGYTIYSNYYTLSSVIFIYKDPFLFTRSALLVGLVNLLFNLVAVSFYDLNILALSTMIGLIVTPLFLVNLINRNYVNIVVRYRYMMIPILIYIPLFIIYFTIDISNIWLLVAYIILVHFLYFKYIIGSLISLQGTWRELYSNLIKH